MHSAMIDHGLKAPEYIFRDGYFTVILRGPGDNINQIRTPTETGIQASVEEYLTERQRHILELLAAGETITNRECQERFQISKVTATKDLTILVEAGLAAQIGRGRSVRYVYNGGNR